MHMTNHELIINSTGISAFDSFNGEYSSKAIEICDLLMQFQIKIVHDYDSLFAEDVMRENDAFGYYLDKGSYNASGTYAEIIVNVSMCKRLCLTDAEMLAAVAHEVGHIILFFHEKKAWSHGDGEEMQCDDYACKMGLKEEMVSLLNKMIDSGEYEQEKTECFRRRIEYILLV